MSKQADPTNPNPNPTDTPPAAPAATVPPTNDPAANAVAPATDDGGKFTQADIDKAVAAAIKDAQKKADDEAAKAQMSKEERLAHDLAEAKRENELLRAESETLAALKDAGANSPKLLFDSKRGQLEFKDGKLANLAEIVDGLKTAYPEQFGTPKPQQGINAGAGNASQTKGRAENLSSALKDFYKK